MEVSDEVSSMVRGWLRASPASNRKKPPPTYVPVLPRPERLGLGAEPHKESADAARSLAVAVRMERKITGRRKQTVADRTVDTTEPKYVRMAESHSQDLRESPDEDCSRSAAVGTSGMKMGGTRSQELLLGGCKGLQKRKRKRRKRRKQEVVVSMATVSKATVSRNDSDLLDSSFKLVAEDNRLEDSQQPSPCTATNVDVPSEDNLEVLRTEAMRSKLDSNKLGKRPKPALQGTKKHGRPSLKKARRRDRLSAGESDQEESPSAAQAAKRTQHEKSIPNELELNTETTSSKDLSTSVQFSGNMKRRLKNAKNSKKLQTDVFTYTNPAADRSIWLQAVQDVDMETGVLSQRRVVHGSRAKRQQLRKAFLYQKRKLMRKRNHHMTHT